MFCSLFDVMPAALTRRRHPFSRELICREQLTLCRLRCTGVPSVLAALSLSFLSNLFGSITHYGSGQAAVYIGSGYLELKDVFKFGALFSVVNLLIWGGVGSLWWKAIGLY